MPQGHSKISQATKAWWNCYLKVLNLIGLMVCDRTSCLMFLPVIALVRLVLFTTMFFVWKKLGSTHSWTSSFCDSYNCQNQSTLCEYLLFHSKWSDDFIFSFCEDIWCVTLDLEFDFRLKGKMYGQSNFYPILITPPHFPLSMY